MEFPGFWRMVFKRNANGMQGLPAEPCLAAFNMTQMRGCISEVGSLVPAIFNQLRCPVLHELAVRLADVQLPPDVRTPMPCRRRRVGADPVFAGHVSVETTERYLGCKQRLRGAVNDKIGLEA